MQKLAVQEPSKTEMLQSTVDALKALSARIAATGLWEPRPGQAVEYPFDLGETTRLRFCGVRKPAPDAADEQDTHHRDTWVWTHSGTPSGSLFGWYHARKVGPDLTDETTCLSLLADLPDCDMWRCGRRWMLVLTNGDPVPVLADSRAEGIALMWLQHRETAGAAKASSGNE